MRRLFLIAGCASALLSGCGQNNNPSSTQSPPSPPVATVGGEAISQELFDAYVKEKTGSPAALAKPAERESLLKELKQLKAASLAGEKLADPAVAEVIELQRLELLAKHAAVAAGVGSAPTDADLAQAYSAFVSALPASEYHTSHILVATESSAAIIIMKLESGVDFAKLARAESADGSKAKGGDIGWIAPGKLPAAFTDAVQALKPGSFTRKPVHTIYGWHVIRLIETRPATAPPFEQVKAQLSANLQKDRYQKFLEDSLRAVEK